MIGFLGFAAGLAGMSLVFFVPGLWRIHQGLTMGLVPLFLVFAGTSYWLVGQPNAVRAGFGPAAGFVSESGSAASGGLQSAMAEFTPQQIEGMVQRLASRLQSEPADPQGWRMLARSYETLGRFGDAVLAYQRVLTLEPPDADLLVDYAVTLGMASGQTLVGDPEMLLERALRLDPAHVQALALSGSAAFEKHDYAHAIAQWERLLALTSPDAQTRESIVANINKAKSLAASNAPVRP